MMTCSAPVFPSASRFRSQLSPCARPFQPSPFSRVVLVRWTPPPEGWLKVNFDGSVYNDGSNRASIGGAIRDSTGRVLVAFADSTEHSTVGIVEARAMLRGLQLARQLTPGRVVVEGDDLVLVQLLRGEETQTRIPVRIQEELLGLLHSFSSYDIRHVYREGNQLAHTLCRQAYHGGGMWFAGMPLPQAVWAKVQDDMNGVVHQRTVVRARRG